MKMLLQAEFFLHALGDETAEQPSIILSKAKPRDDHYSENHNIWQRLSARTITLILEYFIKL
jgi:hypothetical protein